MLQNLFKLRKKIDSIDSKLVNLLEKREALTLQVKTLKQENNYHKSCISFQRENEILKNSKFKTIWKPLLQRSSYLQRKRKLKVLLFKPDEVQYAWVKSLFGDYCETQIISNLQNIGELFEYYDFIIMKYPHTKSDFLSLIQLFLNYNHIKIVNHYLMKNYICLAKFEDLSHYKKGQIYLVDAVSSLYNNEENHNPLWVYEDYSYGILFNEKNSKINIIKNISCIL